MKLSMDMTITKAEFDAHKKLMAKIAEEIGMGSEETIALNEAFKHMQKRITVKWNLANAMSFIGVSDSITVSLDLHTDDEVMVRWLEIYGEIFPGMMKIGKTLMEMSGAGEKALALYKEVFSNEEVVEEDQ